MVGKVQQAHEYSKNLSRRVAGAYEKKRRLARKGESIKKVLPFWLNSDGKLNENADAVKECIDLYLKGYGTRRILLESSIEYPALKVVHPTTLRRWFSNKVIMGHWDTKGEVIPSVFEPLIDAATYYQLQHQLKLRTKVMSPAESYELSGLVKCGECGARYHYRRKAYKGDFIIYANCSTYLKRGVPFCSNNKTMPYEVLMSVFDRTYEEYLERIAAKEIDHVENVKVETLRSEEKDVNTQIETMLDLLIKNPDLQNIKDRISDLSDKKEDIENDIRKAESKLKREDSHLWASDQFALDMCDVQGAILAELDSDSTHRRELLKKAGYSITANNNTMTVKAGAAGEVIYTLVKRSTKYKCYQLEELTPAHTVKEVTSSKEVSIPEYVVKIALNREGELFDDDSGNNWDHVLSSHLGG